MIRFSSPGLRKKFPHKFPLNKDIVVNLSMSITPRFYLKSNKAAGQSQIYLALRLGQDRLFKYGTGKTIPVELWDKETQRPTKNRKLIQEYQQEMPRLKEELLGIKSRLDNLEQDTLTLVGQIEREHKLVSKHLLREGLDAMYRPESHKAKNQASISLNGYIKKFIEDIESGDRLIGSGKLKGNKYTKGTIKTYYAFQVQFNDFQKKKALDWDDITMSTYTRFVKFLSDKGYTNNSTGKNIKVLKTLLRAGFDEGIHSNMVFQRKDFEVLRTEVDAVYLTQEELNRLFELDLSKRKSLELARDVFLVGCNTALRFSDYSRISKSHITTRDDQQYIEIITQKTKEKLCIPVNSMVQHILSKYDYELPKTYEQKVNKYIKEVCMMAGINQEVEVRKHLDGRTEVNLCKKYELVKTHTARRSGATLMHLNNIPLIEICKITGHKREANLLKYIKVTNEETAVRLARNPFFQ